MLLVLFPQPVGVLFQDFLQFLDATGFLGELFPKALGVCFLGFHILVHGFQGKLQSLVLMFQGDDLFHQLRVVLPFPGGFKELGSVKVDKIGTILEAAAAWKDNATLVRRILALENDNQALQLSISALEQEIKAKKECVKDLRETLAEKNKRIKELEGVLKEHPNWLRK